MSNLREASRVAYVTRAETAQVRMCGNSVAPPVARALVAANYAAAQAWRQTA